MFSLSLWSLPHPALTFPLVLLPRLLLTHPSTYSLLSCPILNSIPRCCLAPASAAKFSETVLDAGLTPQTPPEILALEHKETRSIPMKRGDDWTQMLRDTIEELSRRWEGCSVNPSE